MRVSEHDGRSRLADVLHLFPGVIAEADAIISERTLLADSLRNLWRPKVLAQIRQETVLAVAKQRINPLTVPGTRWEPLDGVDWLVVGDRAVCRFKQLDRQLIPNNYPTAQALALEDPDLPMSGLPGPIARFVVGWITDSLERRVQARYVVQPNRRHRPPWFIDLDEVAAQVANPTPISTAVRAQKPRPIKPTEQAKRERGLDAGSARDGSEATSS